MHEDGQTEIIFTMLRLSSRFRNLKCLHVVFVSWFWIYGIKDDLGLCLIPLLQDSGTIWHVLQYSTSFQVPDPEGCGFPTDFVSLSSAPLDVTRDLWGTRNLLVQELSARQDTSEHIK